MTNGEKYKTDRERKDAFALFCAKRWCTTCEVKKNVKARENCLVPWNLLECEPEPKTHDKDAILAREKRVQEVALQLVARTSANVAFAFQLAEEYVAECERRENKIKNGGEE